MDFEKPNKNSVVATLVVLGGIVLGSVVSKAGYSIIHDPNAGTTPDEKNKNKMMGYGKRAAMIAAGGALAASVKGTDTTATLVRALGYGFAGTQGIDGIRDAAAGNAKLAAMTTGSKTEKALAAGFGLSCPCTPDQSMAATALNRAVTRHMNKSKGMRGVNLVDGEFQPKPAGSGFYDMAA